MIIVKLGGSVISDKKVEFSFREDVVRRIAREIAEFFPEKRFMIVHGGGSFGHPLAKKFRIREGLTDDSKRFGFSATHLAMLDLSGRIVRAFLDEGLPAFPVSTSSVFVTENGEVVHGDLTVVEMLLGLGFIPVLFGDVSVDVKKGIDILSGDQIIAYLARKLRPEKVIFLMDVGGIYAGKPGEASLVEKLRPGDIEGLIERLSGAAGIDVTGGIANKLRKAREIAEYSEVWFVNGLVPGRLAGAIRGDTTGTVVSKRP
ncbi:isopentenyl phosphate kinase [Pyrococcus yayanosii]|uniref:Isopentenyl phosphate kinase n=1 Tax=Pyrococcus yayanosii (strain CH1 / JCM 16557) TaxID=529709 RepID=F8AGB9_PYRYC|nr:isopentenyl phosphate kinase [Pyrococcus yayanosii]AEH23961.1 amino acid kinase [Pyrococcus yayanosii CH1]